MLTVKGLKKKFEGGSASQPAVDGVSFDVGSRELILLSGRSGSGKTTLLNLIGGLDAPDEGEITFAGHELSKLTDNQVSRLRREKIGFIFQTFNLVPVISAFENVEYPLIMLGVSKDERHERVREVLKNVGLEKQAHSKPGELSGGQRQRVAIARAIVKRPSLILADEPTANLDLQTAREVVGLIQAQFIATELSIIFCTHDEKLLNEGERAPLRSLKMLDGRLVVDSSSR